MFDFAPDTVFYAIGDVHGLASRLESLHEQILDHHRSHYQGRTLTIVHLGDYVDRGGDSRGVIDIIRALEHSAFGRQDFNVLSLRGNHEQMMLDALAGDPSSLDVWLNNGGRATLRSYTRPGLDVDDVMYRFPHAHRAWLEALPVIIHDAGRKIVFVHAGVNPLTFPDCEPNHYMWTRSARFFDPSRWVENSAMDGYTVVHGHTPTPDFHPECVGGGRRINVDTGAVYGGKLTAVVLADQKTPEFLTA